jgi:hypothetical protein
VKKSAAIVLLLAVSAMTALAQNRPNFHDTENCRWSDGRPMNERDCALFRRERAKYEEQQQRAADRQRQAEERRALAAADRAAQQQAKRDAEERAYLEYQEAKAARDEEDRAYRAKLEREEQDRELAQKKACGRDFQATRVGMKLSRFEQCTDGLAFITETVTKGRVVETYRSTFYLVHAVDGVIVGYTRRTN